MDVNRWSTLLFRTAEIYPAESNWAEVRTSLAKRCIRRNRPIKCIRRPEFLTVLKPKTILPASGRTHWPRSRWILKRKRKPGSRKRLGGWKVTSEVNHPHPSNRLHPHPHFRKCAYPAEASTSPWWGLKRRRRKRRMKSTSRLPDAILDCMSALKSFRKKSFRKKWGWKVPNLDSGNDFRPKFQLRWNGPHLSITCPNRNTAGRFRKSGYQPSTPGSLSFLPWRAEAMFTPPSELSQFRFSNRSIVAGLRYIRPNKTWKRMRNSSIRPEVPSSGWDPTIRPDTAGITRPSSAVVACWTKCLRVTPGMRKRRKRRKHCQNPKSATLVSFFLIFRKIHSGWFDLISIELISILISWFEKLIQRMDPVGMKTTREMNLLNASLQSVPERERPVQRNYYIEVPVSSSGRNPESGGVKNEFSRSKTPPPRPAPPSIASSSNHYATTAVNNKNIRSTESFRHAKSAPMFADEHSHPPVRPLRRKQSKRSAGNKTDSGTQTIHNEMIRPLDHSNNSKPMKKYYLGQDPFNGDPLNPSAPSAHSAQSNNKRQSNGVADIRLEVPEEVSSVQAAPRQPKIQPIPSAQENFRPEWIRQQKIRPTQSWQDNVKDVRPESPEELRYVQTKPRQPKIQPVASAEENIRPEPMRQQQKIRPTKSVEENVVGFRPEEPKVVQQVQTVPRQPKIRPTPSSEENIIAGSGSGSVESGGSGNRFRSTLAASVGRSHSFQLPDRTLVSRRTGPQLNFKLGGSSFRNTESNRGVNPLYKSTSHLNRMNSGVLKSPGIVTSISKSQLDLNKSSAATEPFRPEGTTFYTLPRKRVDKVDPPKIDSPKVDPPSFIQRPDSPDFQPPPPPPVASSPLPDADAESFSFPPPPPSLPSPPSPPPPPLIPANETGRGESFSSIHRRKMEAAKQVIHLSSALSSGC